MSIKCSVSARRSVSSYRCDNGNQRRSYRRRYAVCITSSILSTWSPTASSHLSTDATCACNRCAFTGQRIIRARHATSTCNRIFPRQISRCKCFTSSILHLSSYRLIQPETPPDSDAEPETNAFSTAAMHALSDTSCIHGDNTILSDNMPPDMPRVHRSKRFSMRYFNKHIGVYSKASERARFTVVH